MPGFVGCSLSRSCIDTYTHSFAHNPSRQSKKILCETRLFQSLGMGGLQIHCFPFVLTAILLSCSAVQAEPCRATCANATLDMNFDSSFFGLTLLQTSFGQLCTRCTRLPSLGLRRVSTKKSYVKTHSRRQKFPNC